MDSGGYICEIFSSIDGEGCEAGKPTIFIRLSGCDIKCPPCDTKYSWDSSPTSFTLFSDVSSTEQTISNPIPHEEVVQLLKDNFSSDLGRILITGGEPILQSDYLIKLLKLLRSANYRTCLETSGIRDGIEKVVSYVDETSFDIKLPSVWDIEVNMDRVFKRLKLIRNSDTKIWLKCAIKSKTEETELEEISRKVAEINSNIPLYLHPILINSDVKVSEIWTKDKVLEKLQPVMKYLPDTRFLPQIHKLFNWK